MNLPGAAPGEEPQLLRRTYACSATGEQRQYLLYLPPGYQSGGPWPVMLYLHGTGERGDGRTELDVVMRYGPLAEAWVRRRDLPFIIISPQLPVFGLHDHAALRGSEEMPARHPEQPPPAHPAPSRPDRPIDRSPVSAEPVLGIDETWAVQAPPGGWHRMETELMAMLDRTLEETLADPARVLLPGTGSGSPRWPRSAAMPIPQPHPSWLLIRPCRSGPFTAVATPWSSLSGSMACSGRWRKPATPDPG
jgi:hypothetical protein